MTVVFTVLPIDMMRNGGKQDAGRGLPAANILQVKVAKREGKIYRQRKERQRCHVPDIGAEPLHSATSRISGSIAFRHVRDESLLSFFGNFETPHHTRCLHRAMCLKCHKLRTWRERG
jgi:hypothetical protein